MQSHFICQCAQNRTRSAIARQQVILQYTPPTRVQHITSSPKCVAVYIALAMHDTVSIGTHRFILNILRVSPCFTRCVYVLLATIRASLCQQYCSVRSHLRRKRCKRKNRKRNAKYRASPVAKSPTETARSHRPLRAAYTRVVLEQAEPRVK